MKHTIKIHEGSTVKKIDVETGSNLLKVIQQHANLFYAPCGGNGVCGKCRALVKGNGYVTTCLYTIENDIEVFLPAETEMKVLSSQYKYSKELPFEFTGLMNLSANPLGLAVDIGTTSIVFYIVNMIFGAVIDIKTIKNPQIKYGADVISRINYSVEQDNGVKVLQDILLNEINKLIIDYCEKNDYQVSDFVRISVVGNTVMLHTFMGENALSIALAPFKPKFTETIYIKAKNIGIHVNKDANLILLPSLSAYIGADILAGVNSLNFNKLSGKFLFIDVGTNGEIVLFSKDKILACATAAGPAFEGANLSCGMTAIAGAISSYNSEYYKVIGDTEPIGICGSGIIDIVASLLDKELISNDGNLSGEFTVFESDTVRVFVNQQDIREIQLAKSAIASGIKRLLSIAGITLNDLDNILLAGGFGNYINIPNAIKIGLLPDFPVEKYIQVGNTAGTGAVLALKSDKFIYETEKLKEKIQYIELSNDSDFSMEFAMNMFF